VRLLKRLTDRLSVIVEGSPLTKNDVLQIVIDLRLEQIDANPKLLLEGHIKFLQEKMPKMRSSIKREVIFCAKKEDSRKNRSCLQPYRLDSST
jgi:hypothetical protein